MIIKNPIVWFEIYVNDMERASKFYETILDITLEELPSPTDDDMEMKMFPGDMGTHGASGALVKMGGVSAGGNSTVVYFVSDDCITEEQRIEKAGGKMHRSKMSIGDYGFITLFFDTEGNLIGLHSMV